MRTFERHLGRAGRLRAAGAALERAGRQPAGSARSGRRGAGRLFLAPGDSPIGFRLPLSSLPHVKPIDYPHLVAGRSDERARAIARSRAVGAGHRQSQRGCRRARQGGGISPRPGRLRARGRVAVRTGRSRPHCAHRRAARRPDLRVHAAGRTAGRLPRASRRRRSDRHRARACRSMWRATSRQRIRV